MRHYLYYSSILAIFTEAFVTRYIIDIKLFYFIVFVNLIILVLYRSFLNRKLIFFYAFLLFSGAVSIVLKTNLLPLFLGQLFGILIISFYYFNFFVLFEDRLLKIFRDYTLCCFYVALIGIAIFIFNLVQGSIEPLRSIMLEPAHYATIVLPGFYYALANKAFPRYVWIVILLSILLSGSSLGILGIALSALLWMKRIDPVRLAGGSLIALILLVIGYMKYEPLRQRTDDTYKAFFKNNVSQVNLSTFFLASHFHVATQSLKRNPLLGSGLGSHELSHQKFVYDLSGVHDYLPFLHINAKDAASLFLRVMSDFGLVGLALLAYFIVSNYLPAPDEPDKVYFHLISKAILLYFFCKLLREGHYFSPEMYFFVFAFVFARRAYFKYLNNEPS